MLVKLCLTLLMLQHFYVSPKCTKETELTSCNTVAKDTFQSRCSSVDEQKCVWQKCDHWTSVCCLHESLTFTDAHERAAHIRNRCDPAKLSKILLTTRAFLGSLLSVLNKSTVWWCHGHIIILVVQRNLFQFHYVILL